MDNQGILFKGDDPVHPLLNVRLIEGHSEESVIVRLSLGAGTTEFSMRQWVFSPYHMDISTLDDICTTASVLLHDRLINLCESVGRVVER